jgi:hypothetical protein
VGEGLGDLVGALRGQGRQPRFEGQAGGGVSSPRGLRAGAHVLDGLVQARLPARAEHGAQRLPEQADVGAEGGLGVVVGHGGARGGAGR